MNKKRKGTPPTLGGRIKLVREAFNITRPQLAKMLKVSRQSVMLWENDMSIPQDQRLLVIADRCRVNYEWLRWGRGPMPKLPTPSPVPLEKTPQAVLREIDESGQPIANGWAIPLSVVTEEFQARPDQLMVSRSPSDYPPSIRRGDFLIIDRGARIADPAQPSFWLTRLPSGAVVLKSKTDVKRGRTTVALASFNHDIVVSTNRKDRNLIGRIIAVMSTV